MRRHRQADGHSRALEMLLEEMSSAHGQERDALLWPVLSAFDQLVAVRLVELVKSLGFPVQNGPGAAAANWAQISECLPQHYAEEDVQAGNRLMPDALCLEAGIREAVGRADVRLGTERLVTFIREVASFLNGLGTAPREADMATV